MTAAVPASATVTPRQPDAPEATRPSPARRIVCWATIAAVLPYLTIKLLWISGSTVGVVDLSAVHNRALLFLNTLTLGMDAVAAAVAFALTYRWGRRLPAWLLVPPMWVASGLLGAVMVVVPAQLVWDTARHTPVFGGDSFLRPWVYAVVYSGFIAQGLGLLTAFALYSRSRWPMLRMPKTTQPPHRRTGTAAQSAPAPAGPSSARGLRLLALAAVVSAAPLLYWGFGGTVGSAAAASAHGRTSGAGGVVMLDLARGLAALLAAAGATGLARRGLLWHRLAAVWFGTAVIVAWGLWTCLLAFVASPVSDGAHGLAAVLPEVVAGGAQTAVGLALAGMTLRMARSRVTGHRGPDKIEG